MEFGIEAYTRHYLAVAGDRAQLMHRLCITEPLCCWDDQCNARDDTAEKIASFLIQNAPSMTPEGLLRASVRDIYMWTVFPKTPSENVRSAAARLANSCRLAMGNASSRREKQSPMSADDWADTRALATLMLYQTTR